MRNHGRVRGGRPFTGAEVPRMDGRPNAYVIRNPALRETMLQLNDIRDALGYESPCQDKPERWDLPNGYAPYWAARRRREVDLAIEGCLSCTVFEACTEVRKAIENHPGPPEVTGVLAGVVIDPHDYDVVINAPDHPDTPDGAPRCRRGHAKWGQNLRVDRSGRRHCVACDEYQREAKTRKEQPISL